MIFLILSYIIILIQSLGAPTSSKSTYRAVSAAIIDPLTPEEYCKIIASSPSDSDIVVFPEMTLVALPEEIVVGTTKFNESSQPAQTVLSACAREHNVYVAVSIIEKGEKCVPFHDPRCTLGNFMYNSFLVFDRMGKTVANYRKTHTYIPEDLLFTSGDGKPVVFDTDFGRFGLFVCFDMMFKKPTEILVTEAGATDILWASDYKDIEPWVNPLQHGQGYSFYYGVNVISANMGPSGCYSKGEVINMRNEYKGNDIIVCDMPILKNTQKELPDLSEKEELIEKEEIVEFDPLNVENKTEIVLVEPGMEKKFVFELESMSCEININVEKTESPGKKEYYLFGAYKEDMYLIFNPWKTFTYWCGFINCGENKDDCNIIRFMKNVDTTTYLNYTIDIEFKDEIRAVYPCHATTGKALFKNGQILNTYKGEENKFWSAKSLNTREPVLFTGIEGIWNTD